MSQGPRRFIEDPEWGGAFEGLLQEHGKIEGLPGDVRAEVAALIATSVAGAVGIAAASAAGSAISSAGGAGTAAGSVGALGSAGAGATTAGAVGLGSSVATTALGSTAGAATALTTIGASSASLAVGGASLAAGGASLAAVGLVPKVIAALSLAGAMTAGSVAVVKSTLSQEARPKEAEVERPTSESGVGFEGLKAAQGARRSAPSTPAGSGERVAESPKLVEAVSAEEEAPASPSPNGAEGQSLPAPTKHTATGLAGEVRLLARARAALSENREYAWTLLNEYQRRYPNGALRAEYEVLVRRVQTTPVEEHSPSEGDGARAATQAGDEPPSPSAN